MKKLILKVLEQYADSQVNLASEAAREEIAEKVYRVVGNHLEWWGINPTVRVVDDAGVDINTGKYAGAKEPSLPLLNDEWRTELFKKSDEGQMYNMNINEESKGTQT